MAKTGIKIKRCNVGSVEAHNKRTKEYLEGLEKSGKPLYYFPDLSPNNVSWENPRYERKSCQVLFDEARALYKANFKQEPNLKDREITYKKTGKKKTIAGWSPIREGCAPIKEDTTIEDFIPVVDWARANGLDVIRIDLHFDEGHVDEETNELALNRHAHIVFDWIDHETGKTIKLDDTKMSELQTLLAEALGMERGKPKEETGVCHKSAAEYREMKAGESARRLESKVKELEADIDEKRGEIEQLKQKNESLQTEIDSLHQRVDELSSLADVEEKRRVQLSKTNDALESEQEKFAEKIGGVLKENVEEAISAIEDTSVKKSLFGSKKDREARKEFRSTILSKLGDVIQNPTAHLTDIKGLPEEIRQEYRRKDKHAEQNRQYDNISKVDAPAIQRTNKDLRELHPMEARLLDEMNLQQLPDDVKGRLLGGDSVTVRKKWYDPEKSRHTDEAEATLSVSDWKLRFNGKALRQFLDQVWVRMKEIAQEVRESAQRRLLREDSQQKGKGFKL